MNTNTKGRISELKAITRYIELGYTVLEPINKDGVYDFVIEKDNVFQKVQVKTLNEKDYFYSLRFISTSHNRNGNSRKIYTKEEIDIFVGVLPEKNIIVQIPFDKANKSEMYLRKEKTEVKGKYQVNFLEDFIL